MSAGLVVKVCGLTRAVDALVAAEAGADLAGFVFVPESPRYITPQRASLIGSILPPTVGRVGVFAGVTLDEVRRSVHLCGLSYAQLHGGERWTAEETGVPVIRAVRVGGAEDLAGLEEDPAELLLLDTKAPGTLGGTGKTFDWDLARDICRRRKVLVAGGLNPDNVGEAVRALCPYGVDVASGVEESPGVKDHGKVREFIRAARAAAKGAKG